MKTRIHNALGDFSLVLLLSYFLRGSTGISTRLTYLEPPLNHANFVRFPRNDEFFSSISSKSVSSLCFLDSYQDLAYSYFHPRNIRHETGKAFAACPSRIQAQRRIAAPCCFLRKVAVGTKLSELLLSNHGRGRCFMPPSRSIVQPSRNRASTSRQSSRTEREREINPKFWALYASHLLSTWGDKMWEFSVPFLLLGLNRPDTVSLVGIYALVTGVANISFGPIIGYLVDKLPRLQTLIFTLLLQNVLISFSFLLLYSILSLSTAAVSSAVGAALICGVVICCAIASLASTARFVLIWGVIS
jgi:hypothetical protein